MRPAHLPATEPAAKSIASLWVVPSLCLAAVAALTGMGAASGVLELRSSLADGDGQDGLEDQDEAQERTAPKTLEPYQRCLECHDDLVAPDTVHRPVRTDDCVACHAQVAPLQHSFVAMENPSASCRECHELPDRPFQHEPFEAGECLKCHVPHSSHVDHLLREATQKELCAQCHPAQAGIEQAYIHAPVAIGKCTLCHSPHSTRAPKLINKLEAPGCLDCHEQMKAELANAANIHRPVEENCSLCHDPHATNHRYQLRSDAKEICLECHQPMVDGSRNKPFTHAAMDIGDACGNCHDVHSSALPALLKSPVKDACLSCHDDPIARADGSQFPGMGALLRTSEFLHGPIREGNCEACHDPHASTTFDLLRDPYPMRFYSPYAPGLYALCFRCHDEKVFSTARTSKLTRFRNGDHNLHFLHVNKQKGRTCRTCHETHGSDLPSHMSATVPFGSWDVPINFVKLETGGSCAPGCHEPQTYDYRFPRNQQK